MSEAYSEPYQISKMEKELSTIFPKRSILDVYQGSECAFKWVPRK